MEPVRILANGVSADLIGVEPDRLRDAEALRILMTRACETAGLTMVSEPTVHKFTGGGEGVTGFVMLSESHLAFHTYPEHRLMLMDVLTCGRARPEKAIGAFELALKPEEVKMHHHPRTFDGAACIPAD